MGQQIGHRTLSTNSSIDIFLYASMGIARSVLGAEEKECLFVSAGSEDAICLALTGDAVSPRTPAAGVSVFRTHDERGLAGDGEGGVLAVLVLGAAGAAVASVGQKTNKSRINGGSISDLYRQALLEAEQRVIVRFSSPLAEPRRLLGLREDLP